MRWWLTQPSFSAFKVMLLWHSWAIAELISGEIFWREFPKWSAIRGFLCLLLSSHPKITEEGGQNHMVGVTLILKHWLNSLGLSLSSESILLTRDSPDSPVTHIEVHVCSYSGLCDVIIPSSPLLQYENGSLLLLQGLSKKFLLWRGSREAYISLCGNGVRGLFCFVCYPWLHKQLKRVAYRSWKLHAEN